MYIVCQDGQLRLIGGNSSNEGRAEICFNNTFGTICDDLWDDLDAQVFCNELDLVAASGQCKDHSSY